MCNEAPQPTTCIFCEIVAGRAPAYVVAENSTAMAILDIHPFAEGHCLVIPKRHVAFWHDLEDDEIPEFFLLARQVATRLKQLYKPDFVAIHARGRRIPHAHLFVVPAHSGDLLDRRFRELEHLQETSDELATLRSPKALAAVAAKLQLAANRESGDNAAS